MSRTLFKRIRHEQRFHRVRLCVTVEFPLTALPPRPVFNPPGESTGTEGYWKRVDGDKTTLFVISEEHCRRRPPGDRFAEEVSPGDWRVWSGNKVESEKGIKVSSEPIPDDVIAAYRDQRVWDSTYLTGDRPGGERHLLALALFEVERYAKALWPRISRDSVYKIFRVPRDRRATLRFASTLARVFQIGKSLGVDVKIRFHR